MSVTIDQAKSSKFYLNEFVTENARLVHSIIKRNFSYALGTSNYEEFYQIGMMGLLKAVNNFKSEFGTQFSTYAVPMILGEIKRSLRDGYLNSQTALHVNRPTRELMKQYGYLSGRSHDKEEIMDILDIDEDRYEEIKRLCQPCQYLQDVIHHDDGSPITLGEKLDSGYDLEDISINNIELEQKFSMLKGFLTSVQYNALQLYLQAKTQMQIAAMLNISQVQVSRIIKKITTKICPAINMFYEGQINKMQMLNMINGSAKYLYDQYEGPTNMQVERSVKKSKKPNKINKKEYIIEEETNMGKKLTQKHYDSVYNYAITHPNQELNVRAAWRENDLPIHDGYEYKVKQAIMDKLKKDGYNVVASGRKWWIQTKDATGISRPGSDVVKPIEATRPTTRVLQLEQPETPKAKENPQVDEFLKIFDNLKNQVADIAKAVEELKKPAMVTMIEASEPLRPMSSMSFNKEAVITQDMDITEINRIIETAVDLANLLGKKAKISLHVDIE